MRERQVGRGTAVLGGLVQGQNEFDGLADFGAVDGRLLARADRGDGLLEIGAMPSVADSLNIFSVSVTGWAQVNGRSALDWDEKFALDVWYVDHRSFWLDMKIVVMAFFRVFARTGIEAATGGAVEEFWGSNKN